MCKIVGIFGRMLGRYEKIHDKHYSYKDPYFAMSLWYDFGKIVNFLGETDLKETMQALKEIQGLTEPTLEY